MEHHGIHILAELSECENLVEYDNSKKLAALLRKAAIAAKCQVIKINVHKFEPHGISGLVFLAESHLSIHTWPEDKYVAVDFYACGEAEPASDPVSLRALHRRIPGRLRQCHRRR